MNAFKPEIKTHISLLFNILRFLEMKYEKTMCDTKTTNNGFKRGLNDGLGTIF